MMPREHMGQILLPNARTFGIRVAANHPNQPSLIRRFERAADLERDRFARCGGPTVGITSQGERSEEHTSELQSLMRISYAVFCLKKKKPIKQTKYAINTDIQQNKSQTQK